MKVIVMRLSAQIAISMFLAVAGVGLLAGEAVRYFESNRLQRVLKERANLTISLLNGLMLEAIIIRDVPVIETALREAVVRIPALIGISVMNAADKVIARYPETPSAGKTELSKFTQAVELDGEVFGSISVLWSRVEEEQQIQNSVFQARLYAACALAILTALYLFLTFRLVLRPLDVVHGRMAATLAGKRWSDLDLPKLASAEFLSLAASVNTLDRVLTERDQREEALKIARENSDAASKSKSEFLANMSHEIRTPMNGVIGMAELMLETKLDRDQRLYSDTIVKSGTALLTIINDILDFSKIEAGKMTLEPEPFNLHRALEDIVTLMASKAAQNNVEVSLRYDPVLPTAFEADAGRVRQVVTNIIGNAIKFTHDGQVIVNAAGRVEGNICHLEISISDTGVGIPRGDLKSIFDEFEQVDGAANRKFEGTGLGLAISTRLIRMMGGRISVESEMNVGSKFTISLSLTKTDNLVETEFDFEADLSGKRILVVDDLAINRTILSEHLRNWHASCVTASSAAEALEVLGSQQPDAAQFDLLILDYQMPEVDGLALARSLRSEAKFDSVPMILLSSVEQSADIKAQKEFGFSEVLMKPARSVVLKSAIATALQIEKQPSDTPQESPPAKDAPSVDINPGLKLLVAEDNKTNQLVVKTMLKNSRLDLRIANNGAEAKELFMSFRPDVILMDMSMPVMDGLQASREIRLIEAELNLPGCSIIALTANAMKGDRELCLKAGMNDYLSKPIVKAKLLSHLAKWQPDYRTAEIEAASQGSSTVQDDRDRTAPAKGVGTTVHKNPGTSPDAG